MGKALKKGGGGSVAPKDPPPPPPHPTAMTIFCTNWSI